MSNEIFSCNSPDYIPFNFKSSQEYYETLKQIASPPKRYYPYIRGEEIRFVGILQKLIQKIRVFFLGLTDHTDVINIQAAALKLLYHGDVHGYLNSEQALMLARQIKNQISKNQVYDVDLRQRIQRLYNENTTQAEELREILRTFYKGRTVQVHLSPCWFDRIFIKSFKNKPVHFGEIHLKVAKRYQKGKQYRRALQQYVKAEKIKNPNPSFQSQLIENFTAFLGLDLKFKRSVWQKSIGPLIESLVHQSFANNAYEEALKCVTAGLHLNPNDHQLMIKHFEILFHLNRLQKPPSNFERLLLAEIQDCQNKLQQVPNDAEKLKMRIRELNKILGLTLIQIPSPDVDLTLRAVKYCEQASLGADRLSEIYKSIIDKIILSPAEPTLDHVLTLIEKVLDINPGNIPNCVQPLIQKCEIEKQNFKAIKLFEKAQVKWPNQNFVIQAKTYHEYAKELNRHLDERKPKEYFENLKTILELCLKAETLGFSCGGDIVSLSLRLADQKICEAPLEALPHLQRTLSHCQNEPLKTKYNNNQQINRKIIECYKKLIEQILSKIDQEANRTLNDLVYFLQEEFQQLLRYYDLLLEKEPRNAKWHFEKALIIEAFELCNYPFFNVSEELLKRHLAHLNIAPNQPTFPWKDYFKELEDRLKRPIHKTLAEKISHYLALQAFALGTLKKPQNNDDESIQFLEKALEYAPRNESYRQELFSCYLRAAEERRGFINNLLFGTEQQSIRYFEKALQLKPETFGTHIPVLIEVYSRAKRYSEATALYRTWKNQNQVKIADDVLYQQGLILEANSHPKAAFEMYVEAAKIRNDKLLYSKKISEIALQINQDEQIPLKEKLAFMRQGVVFSKDPVLLLQMKEKLTSIYEDVFKEKMIQGEELISSFKEALQIGLSGEQKNKLRKQLIEHFQRQIHLELPKIYLSTERRSINIRQFIIEHQETFKLLLGLYNHILEIDASNAPAHFDKAMLIDFFMLELYTELVPIKEKEALHHFEKAVELKPNWFYIKMLRVCKNGIAINENAAPIFTQYQTSEELNEKMDAWLRDRFQSVQELDYQPHTEANIEIQESTWTRSFKNLLGLIWG